MPREEAPNVAIFNAQLLALWMPGAGAKGHPQAGLSRCSVVSRRHPEVCRHQTHRAYAGGIPASWEVLDKLFFARKGQFMRPEPVDRTGPAARDLPAQHVRVGGKALKGSTCPIPIFLKQNVSEPFDLQRRLVWMFTPIESTHCQ